MLYFSICYFPANTGLGKRFRNPAHQAIAEFSQLYPEISLSIVIGTHEELYTLLRIGGADLIVNDQRHASSDEYMNFQLLQCGCYIEISSHVPLSTQQHVTLDDVCMTPCILIFSREQQTAEEEYDKNTKEHRNYYIEEIAYMLRNLLLHHS